MTGSVEDRLARALDRVQAGEPVTVEEGDREVLELLDAAGYLGENLARVPAPDSFRRELRDWLAQPRQAPWWRRLMDPVRRKLPDGAGRPAVGAAIGLGAAAALAVGLVVISRWRAASPAAAS